MATPTQLTDKQSNFCRYYLDTCGNASEAYRMAYDCTKMQPATVHRCAFEMLNLPKIKAEIERLREERRTASEDDRKAVEAILWDIITADLTELYYTDPATGRPRMREPWQLPEPLKHALRSIRGRGDAITYDMLSKLEAARILGAWNGWDSPESKKLLPLYRGEEIRIGFDDEDDL